MKIKIAIFLFRKKERKKILNFNIMIFQIGASMHHAILLQYIELLLSILLVRSFIVHIVVIIGVANTVALRVSCVCFLISFFSWPNVFFLDWVLPFRSLTSVCVPFFPLLFLTALNPIHGEHGKLKTESYRNWV